MLFDLYLICLFGSIMSTHIAILIIIYICLNANIITIK